MKELKKISDLKRFLWLYKDIQKIERQIRRLDILDCNVGLTTKQEKRTDKLLLKADSILKEFDLKVYHQSDPRGVTLYIIEIDVKGSNYDYINGIPVY